MNDCGSKMLGTVEAVAKLAAIGLGLDGKAISSKMTLLEHLTGGKVVAPKHEVAILQNTMNELIQNKEAKDRRISLWRVSICNGLCTCWSWYYVESLGKIWVVGKF